MIGKKQAMPSMEPLAFITNLPRNVIMCKFFLCTKNDCKEILLYDDACKIVVVLAINALLAMEAILLGIHGQGVEIDI